MTKSLINGTIDVELAKSMENIAIVEVATQQVVGIKKTGSYSLIPELLMKVYEYTVKMNMGVAGPPIFICHEISPEAVTEAKREGNRHGGGGMACFRDREGLRGDESL